MLTVQITVRDIPNSISLENHIQERAQKLGQFYHHILSCHVVVEMAQKHKHQGKLYSVRIDLSVPGKELVVNRKRNEDIYIAMRDAFNALERQLEDYACRRRGDIKVHECLNAGQIVRLFPEKGFGFIQGAEGSEVYFSASSVAYPQFEKLTVGDRVHFLMVAANQGWQAQRVKRNKLPRVNKNMAISTGPGLHS